MKAYYAIVEITADSVIIKDIGHATDMTVTNDAENVVKDLVSRNILSDQRLLYYDSEGILDEITHKNGKFTGFKPWDQDQKEY